MSSLMSAKRIADVTPLLCGDFERNDDRSIVSPHIVPSHGTVERQILTIGEGMLEWVGPSRARRRAAEVQVDIRERRLLRSA